MGWLYNRLNDALIGHDYPGTVSGNWFQYELDELELGARVAMALDDPEQWFWELFTPREEDLIHEH